MNDITRRILEQMAAGRIPDDIPGTADYADTLRRLAQYFASIQRFTIALSNGDLSQSLQGVTGPVAGGLKSLQSALRHLTWQTRQIAAGDFSQSVDFMGDFSSAFNAMVADLGAAYGQLQHTNEELGREIAARKQMEDALRASQNQLALAMDLSRLAKWESDLAADMFILNDHFYALYGTSADREGGYLMPFEVYVREFVHPDDVQVVTEVMKNALAASTELRTSVQFEHRIVRRDGEIRDIAVRFMAMRDDGGNLLRIYGANQDITEQKRIEKALSQQAHTDQMTGVNNRGYFLELLDVEIERASRYGRPLCVLMLDLDHFKSVNDTHGHAAGDEAIRTVPRVIQATGLRQSDFFGRIGGEEFAVALPETDLRDAVDAAERVRSQLAETPVKHGSGNFSITVSIGVCKFKYGDSQETLLQRADQAMYKAKQLGRNRICSAY